MKNVMLGMLVSLVMTSAFAAERLPASRIDTAALTQDTQVILPGTEGGHLAMFWWIPAEYWQSVKKMDDATRKNLQEVFSGISLLAVAQADISKLGAFTFYPKDQVQQNLEITLTDENGKTTKVALVKKIKPEVEAILGYLKPIFTSAMGNLGNNMHFFVLEDRTADINRLVDPYKKGKLSIQLKRTDNTPISGDIELPLNSLFVPRQCPNGKPAHISWNYCPWSGERLPD